MADTAKKSMTVEEFFAWHLTQEDRYELVEGVPVKMMTGASNYHDLIVTNIIAALRPQLRGRGCWLATPDTATRTKIRGVRRPDVTVTCSEPKRDSYESGDPRLIVEVLSPSNTGVPWQRKLDEYWRLQSLRYLLLVDSFAVRATLYTRTATDWEPTDADGLGAALDMPEIGCQLAMQDVYEGLEFEPGQSQ